MRYYHFIINEGYPEAQAEFAQASGDENVAKQSIDQYRALVNKNQVQGNERNIDWWRKQGWENFSKFVSQQSQIPTKTQVKRQKVAGRSITLMETDQWLIVVPLDKEASCFHGKNSDWCTTKPNQGHFENYFYDREVTLIYCLNKQTGGMWAIAAHRKLEGKWEIFDQEDRSIDNNQFFNKTQLNAKSIVDVALSDVHQPAVQKSRTGYQESIEFTKQLIDQWAGITDPTTRPPRSPEIEKQLLFNKNGRLCYDYIKLVALTMMSKVRPNRRNSPPSGHGLYTIDGATFPEAIAIAGIQDAPVAIKYFENQTERMQMAVIQEYATSINLIENPLPKVQIAAVEKDLSAVQYINDPSPELLKRFPNLQNSLLFMPDEEYNKFLPRVHDLIQEAMDEVISDREVNDDYYREWQAEQARAMGILLFPDGTPYEGDPDDLDDELEQRGIDISDMEIDWDEVYDTESLNNYLEYDDDTKYFYRDISEFLNELKNPTYIKQWAKEYIQDNNVEYDEIMEVEDLDTLLGWILKNNVEVENFGQQVTDNLYIRNPYNKGEYLVKWGRG